MSKCSLSPENKECFWGDGNQLFSCAVHKLFAAWTDLKTAFPTFFGEVKPYECPDYEEESE